LTNVLNKNFKIFSIKRVDKIHDVHVFQVGFFGKCKPKKGPFSRVGQETLTP